MNSTKAARRRKLFDLFDLLIADMLRALKAGNCKASQLDVARKLLADNGITAQSIADYRAGLEGLARSLKDLPEFDPDDGNNNNNNPKLH